MAVRCSLWWFFLPFTLMFVNSTAVTYTDYDIASDRVCSRLGKRELSISMSRPLLVREGGRLLSKWPGVHSFRCKWEVEAKGRGIGVVGVVQKVKFRRLGSECIDYIQFKEDGESTSGPRLCGAMMFGHFLDMNGSLPPPPPSPLPMEAPTTENNAFSILSTLFKGAYNPWSKVVSRGAVVDPKGELKTHVYVDSRPIRSDESLELVIAYSGYQECDGRRPSSGLFHCGYGLCISSLLVNDGLVNCPFGDCIDETSCNSAMASNLTAQILGHTTARRSSGGMSTGVTATSSFFAIAILITIGACICFILRRNKKMREAQGGSEGRVYTEQPGNGEYVGVPTGGAAPTMEQPPQQPMMTPQPPPPGGAPIGFIVPGTPYSPIGMPYPGAGTPYPGTGAPYPGSGAPYPPAPTAYPPAGNTAPYPVQGPPVSSAPSAPGSEESPPPYNSLFGARKIDLLLLLSLVLFLHRLSIDLQCALLCGLLF